MIPTEDPDIADATSAQASLDGYCYQLSVSVLFALDLLANKQQADQITLEPANQEDLEAELSDEPGAMTQNLTIKSRKLVVQCKLRNTGPWTIGDITSLLARGTRRTPPKDLLKDADVSYLLVTSADASGIARNLLVKSPTQWQKLGTMPATLAKTLPHDAPGRVAIWNNLDPDRVEHRIKDLLTDRFRVPQSQFQACIKQLEEGALVRMKGRQAGVWNRKDVIAIIEAHGGYDGTSKDLDKFVPPANWSDLLDQLKSRNAIVLTGPSGTGKTTTAKALIATMREGNAHLTRVKIEGGPERLRDDKTTGPVIYEIEDPWGRYRVEPDSLPWNDAINAFLASASPDRMFVITSRSDVMQDASLTSLDQRYKATLLADNYRSSDRSKLFDLRLGTLPRAEQTSALKYQSTVIKELTLPLELDRFFGAASLGPKEDENEATFIRRCIDEARNQSIANALILVIERQENWEAAAILWALLKARKRLTFTVLEDLEYDLSSAIPNLEDRLSTLTSTLIAGGNLRQDKSEFSCAHPRVEAGLEQAMLVKRAAAARSLSRLLDALIALDDLNQTDWGTETAAHVIAALSSIAEFRKRVSTSAQHCIDDWLTKRLASLGNTFRDDLAIAAKVGSEDCDVAELARWLDESPIDKQWFNMTSWKAPKKSRAWYKRLSGAPHTHAICDAFITRVVAFRTGWFHGRFHEAIAELSPDLTPSFRAALSEIISHGYSPNAGTLIHGAIVDLDGYDAVFGVAAAHCTKERQSRDRDKLLALYNRNYDDEAVDYYWESMGEDGHTASEILRAYIYKRRIRGEWQMFAKHPHMKGFLWEWIHLAQKSEKRPPSEELVALGQAASNSRNEDDYWQLVDRHFDDVLIPSLEHRLREGSEHDATRTSATSVALNHAPHLIEGLFSVTSGLSTQRLLELALDVQSCFDDLAGEESRPTHSVFALIASANNTMKEAIQVLLTKGNAEASKEGISLISTVLEDAPTGLNLSVAQALVRFGQDVAPRLRHILLSTPDVTDENIELLTQVAHLAAKYHDKGLIKIGLEHDFARVRIETMNALFERSSGPLPKQLLKMCRDPSSLVRKRLVGMLKARPDSAHIPTLIKLSYDTWTPDHHRQETDVSHPIAEGAIEILRAEPSLSDEVYRDLIKSLKASDSSDIRLQLLRTMVRHGSPERQKKLINLAIGEGRPTLQRLTAKALFLESDRFLEAHLPLINDGTIAAVNPDVGLWLCMLISAIAADDRLLQTAQSLAANPKRHVFVTMFYLVVPKGRDEPLQDQIANFLPDGIVVTLNRMLETNSIDDLSCLDNIGDVRSVELIKNILKIWFKQKGKLKKRNK